MTSKPTLFKDMTEEEQSDLLLAQWKGDELEVHKHAGCHVYWGDRYVPASHPLSPDRAYRRKPEPVVEERTFYGNAKGVWNEAFSETYDTHKFTFNVVDGEIDCGTVKMEKL